MARQRPAEWFDNDSFWEELYPFLFSDRLFAGAPDKVAKILALTNLSGGSALDLACGPGRIAIPLARSGFAVTGVDRTGHLLEKARHAAKDAGVAIEWVQCDMRDFVRPDRYDLVLSMFTSFGYFDNKKEDLQVLRIVVDDESLIRRVMKEFFVNVGHECLEAENADVALEVMERRPAAVAFVDITMSGHDGRWLTKALRARYPTTAVVLATGVRSVAPKISMQAGVLAYLVKPFSAVGLMRTLKRGLDWHEDAVKMGSKPEDAGDTLDEWLESLDGPLLT